MTMTDEQESTQDIAIPQTDRRPFATFLCEHGKGRLHDELTARLPEVIKAVREHGKVGKIAIELTFKEAGEFNIEVSDKLKVTIPEGSRGSTYFFDTRGGELLRDNPHQNKIPGL